MWLSDPSSFVEGMKFQGKKSKGLAFDDACLGRKLPTDTVCGVNSRSVLIVLFEGIWRLADEILYGSVKISQRREYRVRSV